MVQCEAKDGCAICECDGKRRRNDNNCWCEKPTSAGTLSPRVKIIRAGRRISHRNQVRSSDPANETHPQTGGKNVQENFQDLGPDPFHIRGPFHGAFSIVGSGIQAGICRDLPHHHLLPGTGAGEFDRHIVQLSRNERVGGAKRQYKLVSTETTSSPMSPVPSIPCDFTASECSMFESRPSAGLNQSKSDARRQRIASVKATGIATIGDDDAQSIDL